MKVAPACPMHFANQRDHAMSRYRQLGPVLLACALAPAGGAAQADPWAAPVRGSWVRAGPVAAGDVVLASGESGAEIVVGGGENLNVRQAATFLAGDIEAISGYRPPVVARPTAGKTSIRLATLGNEPVPSAIDASALRGQWESYRIVTTPGTVWLVGSNPRGTAFAAYTLSERLGVDPLYLWTGYVPEHHDPLVLKATRFAQGPPTFRYRGLFHDDEDILPRPFDARGYPLQTGDVPLAWYRRYFETALRLRMKDRKSTRLNSSHDQISYAVFCLKKKKRTRQDAYPDLGSGRAATARDNGRSLSLRGCRGQWMSPTITLYPRAAARQRAQRVRCAL